MASEAKPGCPTCRHEYLRAGTKHHWGTCIECDEGPICTDRFHSEPSIQSVMQDIEQSSPLNRMRSDLMKFKQEITKMVETRGQEQGESPAQPRDLYWFIARIEDIMEGPK